jgi:hypothetical protein
MFDYSYWPEGLPTELSIQMRNFHHKAQILVDGGSFLELGNTILKGQMSDKFFELIVFLPKGYRTLEIANLLHRIVQAGAKVGLFEVEILDQELEQFAIFDNKLLISNKLHEIEKDVFPLIFRKHNDFQRIMENSLEVNPSSQELRMKFLANRYFVSKGQEVELSWAVENANSTILNPGNCEVDAVDNASFLIENDILFTINAKNAKNKSTLSIFIKCLEEELFLLTVSVFNKELSAYVKIDPISEGEESYGVYIGDLLRVEWSCKSATSLSESVLGKLKNVGFHNFICLENRQFDFTLHHFNQSLAKQLKIYPFSAQGLISISQHAVNPNLEVSTQSSHLQPKRENPTWIRKLLIALKINKKNDRV